MEKSLEQRIEQLEKRVAEFEVRVQEQPQKSGLVSANQIIENQIKILQSAQEKCLTQGSFEIVELIAKTLIDITTRF